MYLPKIVNDLRSLLEEFSPRVQANYPNVYGVYEQSEIVLDVSEGDYVEGDSISNELIELSIKVSIATGKATNTKNEYSEADKDLDTMISLIILSLRKKVIPGSQRIKFVKFQKFTPESGKHRSLLTFSVQVYVKDFLNEVSEDDRSTKVREVQIRYT